MLEVRIDLKVFPPRPPRRRKGSRRDRDAGTPVLRDIGFTAGAGEVVALLGPSGTGKSTMLRIILGLDPDFDGTVRLDNRRIGVMFQEPRLMPWLSVEENLRLVRPHDLPPPDIAALLEEVMLPPVEAALPAELSLGMARRVALARALAVDPDILVLDEPFASLDAKLAATLGLRLAERARCRNTLVLLSTHDTAQAIGMASRVLVAAGRPATLLADRAVPGHDDRAAIDRLRGDLLSRFAFLSGRDPAAAPAHPVSP